MNTFKTVQVIPQRVGVSLCGEICSPFSAGLDRLENTGSYTWRIIDGQGTMTTGLHRAPADTYENAAEVGRKFAVMRGYTFIESEYSVLVGNIGQVYDGPDELEANSTFDEYVSLSKIGCGRAAGESVTMMEDNTPVREYYGDQA